MAWIRRHLQACYGRMFASDTLPLRGGMEANLLPTSCIIKITVLRLEKHTKSPEAAASNSSQSNRTVSLCRIWFYWKESQQNYCHGNIKMLPLFAIQTPVLMQLRQRQHVVVTLRFPLSAAEVDSNTEPKMRKDPGILNLSSWLFGGWWSVKLWHHFGDFSPKLDDWNLKFMGQEGLLKCHLVLLGECETTHSCEFRIFLSRFTHYDHIMISYESPNHT